MADFAADLAICYSPSVKGRGQLAPPTIDGERRAMLLEFGLKNFKAFGDTMQAVRFSKLNLICGPNSGGKSSIIQALLLLKQSRTNDYETMYLQAERPGRLVPRGEYVDLGSLLASLHKHELGRQLGITLSYEGHGYTHSGPILAQLIRAELTYAAAQSDVSANISGLKYQLYQDGEVLLDGHWTYDTSVHNHTKIEKHLSIAGIDVSTDMIGISEFGFLPYMYVPGLMPEVAVNWKEASSRQSLLDLVSQLEQRIPQEKIRLLRSLDSRRSFDNVLDSIVYLGPLRSYPARTYTVSGRNRLSTGVRGEFTPNVLYNNPELLGKVNGWFRQFRMPYEITVSKLGDVALTGEYVSVNLIDKHTDTTITLADVGFGINQLLPVIVEGVTTQRHRFLEPEHAIICIEQPEIHLHPRLQAEIADLMIDTSKGHNGKQWIIETHSELLIRRIQRRIEEGALNPSDVSVIYVDSYEDSGSEMTMLRLNEHGEFIDDWPNGFFEESYNEVMGY